MIIAIDIAFHQSYGLLRFRHSASFRRISRPIYRNAMPAMPDDFLMMDASHADIFRHCSGLRSATTSLPRGLRFAMGPLVNSRRRLPRDIHFETFTR